MNEKFEDFNKVYFSGKLAKFPVFICSKPKNFGHEIAGYCHLRDKKILIRNGLGPKSTLQTLIHEMVHIELGESEDHGANKIHEAQFVKELKRLRNLGAPLSPLDFDQVKPAKGTVLNKKYARKLIREAHTIERLPASSVPKFLERSLALPFEEIDQEIGVKAIIQEIY